MTERPCDRSEEDRLVEYALGVLPAGEAREVEAHLRSCPSCRREVGEISDLGDRLLDLLPDAEPPIGFDRRVLAAVRPRRARPGRWVAATVAAAVVAASIAIGVVVAANGPRPQPQGRSAEVAGALRSGGRTIGTVSVSGRPSWVYMTVDGLPGTEEVTCQLVAENGAITDLGAFQVTAGHGSWGAPEPAGTAHLTTARLVGPSGEVLASATLRPVAAGRY